MRTQPWWFLSFCCNIVCLFTHFLCTCVNKAADLGACTTARVEMQQKISEMEQQVGHLDKVSRWHVSRSVIVFLITTYWSLVNFSWSSIRIGGILVTTLVSTLEHVLWHSCFWLASSFIRPICISTYTTLPFSMYVELGWTVWMP